MIICRTPLRISFFGGGSDYKEWVDNEQGIVLSSAIDKYIYITLRELPKFFIIIIELFIPRLKV